MSDRRFSRRRFISSAGVAITLPMLPSLLYARRAGAATCTPLKRFVAYHFPNIVDHVGGDSSLTGNTGPRHSCTFVGESFDALDLTRTP